MAATRAISRPVNRTFAPECRPRRHRRSSISVPRHRAAHSDRFEPLSIQAVAPVSRRTFLRLSAVAATPAALFQTPPASTNPTVIIGAGLAGLHAADLLRRAGRPVVVLEAR